MQKKGDANVHKETTIIYSNEYIQWCLHLVIYKYKTITVFTDIDEPVIIVLLYKLIIT